ncbi:sensor histidine kinase [Desulfosporosinus nitroreducens]|uniref:histidine kinase n=1 Tax=Desulfosporosinus nitroreducens TaxID=2018668 RepID=A0ABT8QPV7_9FIRM|nr:GAF domain-containing sensor histidine kinase [Desulfosporosinus nitroreducens]MCO1601782.1 GAF domain-containing sensor histidine kinase [Desulfosporosinus nitroreducens]MDO0823325.1 GAF domain-containing sensor histidine kinase [Desulfosporosinus nitroreducens]
MSGQTVNTGSEQLYEQLQREMAVLIKINNLTGFLPVKLDNLLSAIIKEIDNIFFPYKCELHLITEGRLETCCTYIKDDCCKALNDQLPLTLEQGERLCCEAEFCANCYQFHVCVPLIAGVDKLGVVTLKSKQKTEFHRDSMELLLAVVSQIAATIQRARLFSRLAQEKANLEKANTEINQLNQELQKSIEQLNKAQEQLVISERLAAAGQLSANLAHEINNPIGVILSRLEWLLLEAEENSLPDQVIEDMQIMVKHTERIARTTKGLLSFSRQTVDCMSPLDLNTMIIETTDWLRSQFLSKNIQLDLKLASNAWVLGNPGQLEQVLVNLLNNAKDAIVEGGEISICSKVDLDQKMVQVEVSDSGTGISDEIKNRIFDPFFTTKEKGVGTGLGLSISYGILENHGGSLKVESELGKGSCFSLLLPLFIEAKAGDAS